MDEHVARAARVFEEVSKTADRLARRMGAEFVPDPQAIRTFQHNETFGQAEPLPMKR